MAHSIKEIKVKPSNVKEIRIGFIHPDVRSVFQVAAWDIIKTVNPLLVRVLRSAPKKGPYSGGENVLISAFRESSIDQLFEKVAEWSKTIFRARDIIIQKGRLKMLSQSTGTVKDFDVIIVTVLKCEREKPTVIVGDKLVLVPA